MNFQANLHTLMQQAGDSSTSLAAAIDESQSTVWRYAEGKVVKHNRAIVEKIAAHYGVTPEYLYRESVNDVQLTPENNNDSDMNSLVIQMLNAMPAEEAEVFRAELALAYAKLRRADPSLPKIESAVKKEAGTRAA